MDEVSPQLLDLITEHHKDKEFFHMNNNNNNNNNRSCEERKLELRLAPPGVEDWSLHHHTTQNVNPTDDSRFSLGYFSQQPHTPWSSSRPSPSLDLQNAEKKLFSPSQKRTAPGPVVGWPPIRSFRKNIANSNISSSKTSQETNQQQQHHHHHHHGKRHVVENNNVGKFVKINMDGVPIGRKVDLNAYDTYEKLSSAVDQLFRCLLAAQRDSCAGGIQNKKKEEEEEKEKSITGLLDGSGEYTLVYEDNEGDRMLVGDVPWHMFVSTVKRLRVLKTCDLSNALTLGSKQDKKSK